MEHGAISPQDALLSVSEVSRELGKSRYAVVRLIAARELAGRPGTGRTLIVTRRSLDDYKRRQQHNGGAGATQPDAA